MQDTPYTYVSYRRRTTIRNDLTKTSKFYGYTLGTFRSMPASQQHIQKNGNDRTRLIVSILQNGFTISEASSVLRRIREQ